MQRTLKEWRAHLEISQNEMSYRLNVSPSTYNIWENSPEEIRAKTAISISQALGVPIEDIIFYNKKLGLRFSLKLEEVET